MNVPTDTGSRRAAMAKARQSRRPSRLGTPAGAAPRPDHVLADDAGFPSLLARAWRVATTAPDLSAAVRALLTLDGHVPADVQLRALRIEEEAALRVLCGPAGREHDEAAGAPATVFLGELGLTTTGRLAISVPSTGALAGSEELVDGVIRVPWSRADVAKYADMARDALAREAESVADCRRWLSRQPHAELLDQLKEAALRTAPFILYQGGKRYTNFREHNNLTGKTLWPGHPDCALSSLRELPLELWSDNDAVLVVCLTMLVRSVGFARIEEANGTQLTVDHVAELLARTRERYNGVPGGQLVPAPASATVDELAQLADALRARRTEISRKAQLYREIHGPLMHKIERVAAPPGDLARRREDAVCARLRARLPVTGTTLPQVAASVAAAPAWLARPHGDFGTGLESLVYETVTAARDAFETDFAMSRGLRSLPALIAALRARDWARVTGWELPQYFCCVAAVPHARRHFDDSLARLADVAWAISSRMQYNSWHFIAGNLPRTPEVVARDYFVPPTIPDLSYYSDQHHNGHVAASVRFSIRSPQPVTVAGRTFTGFIDLRLLRCAGEPFTEQDLVAAHHTSAFVAGATSLAAGLAAAGAALEVTAFDSRWHWSTITGERESSAAS
jgi:hypothetical protein